MTVKKLFTCLPEKSEHNAHCDKNSNLTKKTERLTSGLHSNVTRMWVTFESNARGLLTVEDGSTKNIFVIMFSSDRKQINNICSIS